MRDALLFVSAVFGGSLLMLIPEAVRDLRDWLNK